MTDNLTSQKKQDPAKSLIEIIARSICDSIPGGYGSDHRQHTIAGDPEWHLHRRSAASVKRRLEKSGYAIVPIEPTAEMLAEIGEIDPRGLQYSIPVVRIAHETWCDMIKLRPR